MLIIQGIPEFRVQDGVKVENIDKNHNYIDKLGGN